MAMQPASDAIMNLLIRHRFDEKPHK